MPHLDSVRDEFTDRNVVLHLFLGLISAARRLDALLPSSPIAGEPIEGEAQGEAPPPSGVHPTTAGHVAARERRSGDDRLVLLLLGVISLRRTLMAELDPLRAAPVERGGAGHAGEREAPALRLRDLLR